MPKDSQTIVFLFGSHPQELALLEAGVLANQLDRQGCAVQWAALSPRAARLLRSRFDKPAIVVRTGLAWLGGLGRRRLPAAPLAVHAWDLEAAHSAGAIAGGVPLCVTLPVAKALAQAGLPAKRIQVVAPAVDAALLQQAMSRRAAIRERLGLAATDAPVFAVPRLPGRDQGHFRAGWATMLLRKGGVPARLLLPEPNREANRIVRFARAGQAEGAIAIAPTGMPWLEILAASDALVVPSPALYDPAAVAWAMAARRPVVTAGLGDEPPLLDATTYLASESAEPLNLARALLRVWQDRALAESMVSAASERVGQVCDPAARARVCLEAYRGGACRKA